MGHLTDLRTGSARACIAARLAALDRPADFLTDDAVEALLVHAGGSLPRLRAALASTLFLGSTEDTTRVDHTHVERAVAALPPTIPSRPRRTGMNGLWLLIGAAIGALAVGIPMTVWRIGQGTMVEQTPAAQSAANAPAPGPRKDASQQAAPPIAPSPDTAAPKLPLAIAVDSPPLPPFAQPLAPPATVTTLPPHAVPPSPVAVANLPALRSPPPVTAPPEGAMTALPAQAPPTIVLRYQPTDRWAADKLAAAGAYLRQAGLTRIYAVPLHGHATQTGVRYFFTEDQDAARQVLRVATGPLHEGRWAHRRAALRLVPQPAGKPAHPPGTIELIIP
jgi:hypothetical protein